jgi:3-dehydroquinate dehydratase-1
MGKIVTTARTPEDNLTVLSLIPWAKKNLGLPLVAFAMGPLGKLSRVAAPLLGAPYTYAALPGREKAAPGQLDAVSLKEIFKSLSPFG